MSIFSAFSRKTDAKPSPGMTRISVPQSTFYVRQSITPDTILNARYLQDQGKLKSVLGLYSVLIKEDDATGSAADIRSEALKAASVSFNPQNLTQPQIDYFNALIRKFAPLWTDMLIQLKLTGALFRQIEYRFDGSVYLPEKYVSYPNADLRIQDGALACFNGDLPLKLDPLKFLNLTRENSVLYSAIKYHVFFSFALNNWAQFTETFGKPPRIAKYKPGTTKAEKDELWSMLQSFGTDLAAMVSDNVVIDFADFNTKSASVDLYHKLCEFCDDRITRRITGNTLTTKAVGDGGSYAQAKVHNLVRGDILAGDCRDAQVFLSEHLTMLNRINFGGEEIEVKITPPKDTSLIERIQVDTVLYNQIGIEFPEDYWYRTYGVPAPQDR